MGTGCGPPPTGIPRGAGRAASVTGAIRQGAHPIMNSPHRHGVRNLVAPTLALLAAALLSACGGDMHDTRALDGAATAGVTLQVTGAGAAAAAAITGPGATPPAVAGLQLGGGVTLQAFRLGLGQLALRPAGGDAAADRIDEPQVADLLSGPGGHRVGALAVPGGQAYQMDVDMAPMAGTDPTATGAAAAMVIVLAYDDPASGLQHRFLLRWDAPVGLHMDGSDGLMMEGGEHELILAFDMAPVFSAPYGAGTILDALLSTPMDADGVHVVDANAYPELCGAILAGIHDNMTFGEDMAHDGHLHDGDDHMVGHHGGGGMM